MGLWDYLETRSEERTKRRQSKDNRKTEKQRSKDDRKVNKRRSKDDRKLGLRALKNENAADRRDELGFRQSQRQASGTTFGEQFNAGLGATLQTAEVLGPSLIPLLAGQPSADLAMAGATTGSQGGSSSTDLAEEEEWSMPMLIGAGLAAVGTVLGGVALVVSLR